MVGPRPPLNYDFWYQPRKNVLVSSEWGEPNAYESGFDIADVGKGRYGHRLHFWDLAERRLVQTLDLGEQGLVPLEVRFLHDPETEQGFCGVTLSSKIVRFHRTNGSFQAEPVIEVDNEELEGWHEEIDESQTFEDLPKQAQGYVRRMEELVGVPVSIVSVGPAREQSLQVARATA